MRTKRSPVMRHPVEVMHMYARVDQAFEKHIHRFLRDAEDASGNKIFESVTRHDSRGLMRRIGIELTTQLRIDGKMKWVSFAVTTSKTAYMRSKNQHPEVKIFYTPINYDLHKLLKSILKLF